MAEHDYPIDDDITVKMKFFEAYMRGDVAPVVPAHWELAEDGWYCTACNLYPPFDCDPEEKGIPYCPWCGAKIYER